MIASMKQPATVMRSYNLYLPVLLCTGVLLLSSLSLAQDASQSRSASAIRVSGQVLYVPVYSHIFSRTAQSEFDLTTTLSVRNTDRENALTLVTADYYDSEGALVRAYIEEPQALGPLVSVAFVVEERDTAGGAGANFIVEWQADAPVTPPVVEAVMISTTSNAVLEFQERGDALADEILVVGE